MNDFIYEMMIAGAVQKVLEMMKDPDKIRRFAGVIAKIVAVGTLALNSIGANSAIDQAIQKAAPKQAQ